MNPEGIRSTELCHWPSIRLFEKLMKDINIKNFGRAIDVGCGDGRFTRDHLVKKYDIVDMFDINGPAIETVKDL